MQLFEKTNSSLITTRKAKLIKRVLSKWKNSGGEIHISSDFHRETRSIFKEQKEVLRRLEKMPENIQIQLWPPKKINKDSGTLTVGRLIRTYRFLNSISRHSSGSRKANRKPKPASTAISMARAGQKEAPDAAAPSTAASSSPAAHRRPQRGSPGAPRAAWYRPAAVPAGAAIRLRTPLTPWGWHAAFTNAGYTCTQQS